MGFGFRFRKCLGIFSWHVSKIVGVALLVKVDLME